MYQAWRKVGCALLAATVLYGCSSEKDVITPAPVPDVKSAFEADTVWSHGIGDGVGKYYSNLKPAILGDVIYAASRDGDVYAFDKVKGEKLWHVDLTDEPFYKEKRSARISGGLTVYGDHVLVGSENGDVLALNRADGKLVWHTNVGGEVLASPAADMGKVVVSTGSGEIIALDDATGNIDWTTENDQPSLTLRGTSTPVIAAGGVIFGRADGKVGIALLQNGQLVNQSRISTPRGQTDLDRISDVDATPLVVDDELLAVSYNGQLVARKLITGDELWKRTYSAYEDMGIGPSDIALTDSKSHIYLINKATGDKEWENTELEYRHVTTPLVLGDYVVVGDGEGYLYWLSQTSGKIVAMQRIDSDGLYTAPIMDNGMIYIQTRGGELVALKRPS